jgi:hypothetical protein
MRGYGQVSTRLNEVTSKVSTENKKKTKEVFVEQATEV